jgi:methionine--tRNA ligase beta chain
MAKTLSFKDFQKMDIRIGTVVSAEIPKWSHWVIKLTVDLGEEIGQRTIFAGLLNFYKTDELEGKQFPFVVNLEPKKIGPEGDMSEGMMLAACVSAKSGKAEDEEPVLLTPVKKLPNGARVR